MHALHRYARASRRFRLVGALAGVALLAASAIGVYISATGGNDAPAVAPLPTAPKLGGTRPLPEFQFRDGLDRARTLSDFRGKNVLLNIWATWCAPCREEMPALDRLQQKLGGPEFEVLALSIDVGGTAAVRRFFDETGVRSLAIYVDPSMDATEKLRVVGLPTTLLVDRGGRERWRKIGPAKWDSPEVVKAMRAQLQGATR